MLHVLSAFRPFFHPQKEYKNVLDLKLAWEEEVKAFLKWWVQLSIVKFAICYQQKKYNLFSKTQ